MPGASAFLRNLKFVEANAKGRNLHGRGNPVLRSLNDFDRGLLAHFISRVETGRRNLIKLALPSQVDAADLRRKAVALFRGVDHRNEELFAVAGERRENIQRVGRASSRLNPRVD